MIIKWSHVDVDVLKKHYRVFKNSTEAIFKQEVLWVCSHFSACIDNVIVLILRLFRSIEILQLVKTECSTQ